MPRPRQLRECEACLKDILPTDGHGSNVLWGMTKMCAMEKLAVMYKLVPMLVSTVYLWMAKIEVSIFTVSTEWISGHRLWRQGTTEP